MADKGLTEQQYQRLITKARTTNSERDALDRRNGFARPSDCGAMSYLRTVHMAMEAGMKMQDWDCVAEAYAMLEDIFDRYAVLTVRGEQ